MRTTAGILMLGVLAWVAGPSHAADKKCEKVTDRFAKVFERKSDIKQCGDTCCGAPATLDAPVTVHETHCPKSDGCCAEPVCLGTSTKKAPAHCHQRFVDWLCYRPLQSSKCCNTWQPMPARQPHVWYFFAHRCCNCSYAGIVDSPCCDAPHAAAPAGNSCNTCKAPAPARKPILAKLKKPADQFASDCAQPVGHKEAVK